MSTLIQSVPCSMLLAGFAVGASTDWPQVREVGTVSPSVISVSIRAQRVERAKQVPYKAEEGDVVGEGHARMVTRDGKRIGSLVGTKNDLLFTFDELRGEPLDVQWASSPQSYRIVSSDDVRYAQGLTPSQVARKTRPFAHADTVDGRMVALDHYLYLTLPKDLQPGSRYALEFVDAQLQSSSAEFVFDVTQLRSEAVHVSQIGFRPDDPGKVAFLSCWMGDGGAKNYPEGLKFQLIDRTSGKAVYEGKTQLSRRATEREPVVDRENFVKADVYQMDFSSFATPGNYHVSVEGVGCSLPFPISPDAWSSAFYHSIRGLYHQRSGIELGPPYTNFIRPRGFHPDDGVKIWHSTFAIGEPGHGWGPVFPKLVAGKTDHVVPNAWGGYMDAADWDRRPIHIQVPRMLLELYTLAPERFGALKLNIPESSNNLPDLIDEALWLVDFHLRMQGEDGSIRPGIESAEHPRRGEGSWQESLDIMAYAPGPRFSYCYAGVAAYAAHVMQGLDSERAATYRKSALRAWEYAEKNTFDTDERTLAAAELFRLTGEEKYHEIFRATTRFAEASARYTGSGFRGVNYDTEDAAGWVYLNTDRPGMDETIKATVKRAILASADKDIEGLEQTALHFVPTQHRFTPWGTGSNPDAVNLVRAHHMTGDAKYLRAAVLACQHAAGSNPLNLVYTSGIGVNPVRWPIHCDAKASVQMAPPGLTVFGPIGWDRRVPERHRPNEDVAFGQVYPAPENWPTAECYFDMPIFPPMTEFTVDVTIAPTAYVWGYLSVRPNEWHRATVRVPTLG